MSRPRRMEPETKISTSRISGPRVPALWGVSLLLVPACIVPLAPEFEEEKRAPPFVASATPAVGTVVKTEASTFEVFVEDPNVNDDLYARWIVDYPPFTENLSRSHEVSKQMHRGDGRVNRHRFAIAPDCRAHQISPAISQHRLMLVVSDRPFDDSNTSGEKLPDKVVEGYALRLIWIFDKECRP